MILPLCNLCKSNPADKENSHIIPKFLCARLFESTKHRYSIKIGKNGRSRRIQDTPKEDNILCSSCEKRISIIESHFSRVINDIHNFSNLPEEFNFVGNSYETQYIECMNLHPTLFKLFVYSLIWRASISKLPEYKNYGLPELVEEEVRLFLNANLAIDHQTLLGTLDNIIEIPSYHFCFLKPLVKSENTRGVFTAYNYSESRHLLLIIDFAIFFFSDDQLNDPVLRKVSNKQNEKVIIGLGENNGWTELNRKILEQMLKQ